MKKNKKSNFDDMITLDEEEYYKTGNGRGTVKVLENDKNKEKTVSFNKEIKDKRGNWIVRKGFWVPFNFVGRFIEILINFSNKFKWNIPSLKKDINMEQQIRSLKEQLNESFNEKIILSEHVRRLEDNEKINLTKIAELKSEIIKNNIQEFDKDIEDFSLLLKDATNNKIKEKELQEFLKKRPWIFGVEYHNSEPKKPVGSKNEFDFYFLDYKNQGTIIELKLPSENILKDEYEFSAKTGESLGQLIRYMETTMAYSYNKETSKIEKVDEIRPKGFLIIGKTINQEEMNKLKIINSYLKGIEILSYDMLLAKAKSTLFSFNKTKEDGKNEK